jgi:hypothetical protein
MTYANRKSLIDVSRQAPETQLQQLKRSCDKLIDSINRAGRNHDSHKVLYLSTMLSNQRAKMEAIAFKISMSLQDEPKPIGRVLPDLTTDWRKYMPTNPMMKRFEQSYGNNGKLYRPKITLHDYTEIKRPGDKDFKRLV